MTRCTSLSRFLQVALLTAVGVAVPFGAFAGVRKEGTWPSEEKRVTLEFEGKPGEGLERLAKEAGWSLVLSKDAIPEGSDVHVAVTAQPADAVLEALFADGDVVARRSGDLVTVTRAAAAVAPPAVAPPAPPLTPAPPLAPARAAHTGDAADREVFGGKLVLREDEVAHNVTVTGGSARIEGTMTGDLVVMGGSAVVTKSAHVSGAATVLGGSLRVEGGAHVDGDVGVLGGVLRREPGAVVGGHVVEGSDKGVTTDDDEPAATTAAAPQERGRFFRSVHDFGKRVTRFALLFVLGCVLLALLGGPMDAVRVEAAARPMRSFAVGVVSAVAIPITLIALCLTVVGIPLAILSVLLLAVAVYGALAGVLTTLGALVTGHRTKNPYVHLGVGCGLTLVVTSLPWVGGLATAALTLIAVGALVATRGGGLVIRSRPRNAAMV